MAVVQGSLANPEIGNRPRLRPLDASFVGVQTARANGVMEASIKIPKESL